MMTRAKVPGVFSGHCRPEMNRIVSAGSSLYELSRIPAVRHVSLSLSLTHEEDDESSAHTSAAAVDSDDVARMEDTVMDYHESSVGDFDFALDPVRQPLAPIVSSSSLYPKRAETPPQAVGYESFSPVNLDLSTNASRASSPLLDFAGHSADQADDAEVPESRKPIRVPPPPREEQYTMVKELTDDKEAMALRPGDMRFLVSRRYGRRCCDALGLGVSSLCLANWLRFGVALGGGIQYISC